MRAWMVGAILISLMVTTVARAAPDGNTLVTPALVADVQAIEPAKPFRVAVHFKIEPKWHIYWLNPGDSGQPPEVKWKLPEGFTAGDLQWPVPHRFDLPGSIVNYGYEGEAALVATITPPAKIDAKSIDLSAELTWLVCDPDLCLPGKGSARLSVPVGRATTSAHVEDFDRWTALLPQSLDAPDAPASLGADAGAISANPTYIINWKNPARRIEWFIAPPDGISVANTEATTSMQKTTRLVAEIKREGGNIRPSGRIYSVVAYSDESGNRKGIELWLTANVPPDAGGGGKAER